MDKLDSHIAAYTDKFDYSFDNKIMLNWYPKRVMEATSKDQTMLELGVGHGYTSALFSEFYSDYAVIDASRAVLDQFKKQYPHSKARVIESYFENFVEDKQYDIIMMGFILEHVDDPLEVLRHFRKFMKKSGRLFVAVPNAMSLHRRIGNKAGVLDDMMALGGGDIQLGHQRLYTVESLTADLESCGYKVKRKEGLFLKPLTTGQMVSLDLPENIIEGMCLVGIDYPELSAALLFEATL